MSLFDYQDTATFVWTSSNEYGDRTVIDTAEVDCSFFQDISFIRSQFADSLDTDAIMYVDPDNQALLDKYYRLEGVYVLIDLFGASEESSWFRVVKATISRDNLLSNQIDNIELALKKARPIPNVS